MSRRPSPTSPAKAVDWHDLPRGDGSRRARRLSTAKARRSWRGRRRDRVYVRRRIVVGLGATLALVALAGAFVVLLPRPVVRSTDSAGRSTATTTEAAGGRPSSGADSQVAGAERYREPGWIADENAKEGTASWQVGADPAVWSLISGFADRTSVDLGDSFVLRVSTGAPTFRVEAYRMGFYAGLGGRLIWSSDTLTGVAQPPAVVDESTGMAEAPWSPSLTVQTDVSWPPGQYMLKLISADGGANHVPIVVRDDQSHAALVMMSAVTTWQAYNEWGAANLYTGAGGPTDDENRSRVVTFDRPYWNNGSGHFFGGEFELVNEIESLGLDVTYWTSVDLHQRPEALSNHRALLSLGHDEYWSTAMRAGAESARDSGVNLAFLGANAVYRRIRLEDSPLGPNRREVNYRSAAEDPLAGVEDEEVTTSWREPPDPRPESELIGDYYECNPVEADMVVVDPEAWVFEGTGVTDGAVFPGLVGNEYDRVTPEAPTPENIEVLAHSPVTCRGIASYADMTYYTAPSGAGVFATGTLWWIRHLTQPCPDATVSADCQVRRITENVLRAFAEGPAGEQHPSVGNLDALGIHAGYVSPTPGG